MPNPDQLKLTANHVKSSAGTLKEKVNDLKLSVNKTRSSWKGETGDAFGNYAKKALASIEAAVKDYGDVYGKMNTLANAVSKAEKEEAAAKAKAAGGGGGGAFCGGKGGGSR